MTVALRAHHLLCVLTYVGKGYNAAFVANFNQIVQRLSAGESAHIVTGPDAICAPLCCKQGNDAHCMSSSVVVRDQQAAHDLTPLMGQALHAGAAFVCDKALLQRLRDGFAKGTIRSACQGCEWHELCSQVARDGYRGTLLQPRQNSISATYSHSEK
ncbi:MAG: DUF1284 domain-containing protein [Brachymonas sp.]|nr:DUF1284 domain-containing protein [Brachymonas sp.]